MKLKVGMEVPREPFKVLAWLDEDGNETKDKEATTHYLFLGKNTGFKYKVPKEQADQSFEVVKKQ